MELLKTIEELIDKHGLTAISDAISEVCYAKAEHIKVSYGDLNLSGLWDKAGASFANRQNVDPS